MYTVFTKANRLMPAGQFQVYAENIICNDVMLPEEIEHSYNPRNIRMFIIGATFGVNHCIFAESDQEALDLSVNENKMDFCLAEEQDYDDESLTALGNASELFDLSDVWMAEVDLNASRDIALIIKLVRAQEQGKDTLDF